MSLNKSMLRKLNFIIPVLIVVLTMFYALVKVFSDFSSNENYTSSIGWQVKGMVSSRQEAWSDIGLISLDISRSNIKQFDDRHLDKYFGVIDNKKAEFITHSLHSFNVGDSVIISDSVVVFEGVMLKEKLPISLPHNLLFIYSKLRKLHSL